MAGNNVDTSLSHEERAVDTALGIPFIDIITMRDADEMVEAFLSALFGEDERFQADEQQQIEDKVQSFPHSSAGQPGEGVRGQGENQSLADQNSAKKDMRQGTAGIDGTSKRKAVDPQRIPAVFITLGGSQVREEGGNATTMQIFYPPMQKVYILHLHHLGYHAFHASATGKESFTLASLLRDGGIMKACWDLRKVSRALFLQYDITMCGVIDIRCMYQTLHKGLEEIGLDECMKSNDVKPLFEDCYSEILETENASLRNRLLHPEWLYRVPLGKSHKKSAATKIVCLKVIYRDVKSRLSGVESDLVIEKTRNCVHSSLEDIKSKEMQCVDRSI